MEYRKPSFRGNAITVRVVSSYVRYCSLACLLEAINRMVKKLDAGGQNTSISQDTTADSLRALVIAYARWEVEETGTLYPYNDGVTGPGQIASDVKIIPRNK